VIGLLMLLISLADIPPLWEQDVVLGLTTRTVLVMTGVLHLMLSGYLFAARDLMNQGIVTFWAGLNHLIYALGLVLLKAAAPFPIVVSVAWKLGISSRLAEIGWKLLIGYLLFGSLVILVLERR